MKYKQLLNSTYDGLAATLKCAHHYAGNITNPRGGRAELGVIEVTEYIL